MESVPELAGSMVARAWTVFVEESEKVVRHVKEGAEHMAASTLEKLNALYAEKKANRKQYHEEYARVAAELSRLQDAVAKTRQGRVFQQSRLSSQLRFSFRQFAT